MNNTHWRPTRFSEYIGQLPLVNQLAIEVSSSKRIMRPLNHAIFYGPGGLGKTTLVSVLAAERGLAPPVFLLGKEITHEGITEFLLRLNTDGFDGNGDLIDPRAAKFHVVVIDEADGIGSREIWELLHQVLEPDASGRQIMVGKGPNKKGEIVLLCAWLPQITLIVITNFFGKLIKLSPATMSRFPIKYAFTFYSDEEIHKVISQYAAIIQMGYTDDAVQMIAKRSNGVPRLAIQYARRAMDFMEDPGRITNFTVARMFDVLGIDHHGLDRLQFKYLQQLIAVGDGRLGVEAIASLLTSDRDTVEQVIEPALFRNGMVVRTASGREITNAGRVIVLGKSAASLLCSRAV